MKMRALLLAALPLCGLCAAQDTPPVQPAEPYAAPYADGDATGDHVLGLWQFDAGAELQDGSGNGHELTLRGAELSADGRFGGALRSFRGHPVEDTPHQAVAKNAPALSPTGAFSLEMWVCPDPELEGYPEAFLLDKKYVSHDDYQWTLSPDKGTGYRSMNVRLGFGQSSEAFISAPVKLETGKWRHLAFAYDGEGTGRFYVDGAAYGSQSFPGRKGISAGRHPLCIGDRVGSLYHGFPGRIDQVRLCRGALQFTPADFSLASLRRVYVRMEEPPSLVFSLTNRRREPLEGARAFFSLGGLASREIDVPTVPPGGETRLSYALDTSLRPDRYRLAATVELPGDPPYRSSQEFDITIVPRPLPERMPVVMWGGALDDIQQLTDLGFSHAIGLWADLPAIWEAGEPTAAAKSDYVASSYETMDRALANGVGVVVGLSPGSWARQKEPFRRVDRDGRAYEDDPDVNGLHPEVQQFCYNVGASVARTYGAHPALQAAMVHTEVRGASRLSYAPIDREAYRAFSGVDIPEGLTAARGTAHKSIPGFPENRVIPDDFPMHAFYRWFRERGDGWNDLHTQLHRGLRSTGREDLWTYHDPAVRVASVYGNGGEVDYLSQWTYSYPDPIRIGLATDELLCMAAGSGRPDQQVMKMTQIIWYRSQTAPEPGEQAQVVAADFSDHDVRPRGRGTVDASGRYVAGWEREKPDARFITIAPMHLREAFWTKIARPIRGIMYHGWQSLVDKEGSGGSYRYTHPDTKAELRRLVGSVVEPLGPTLMQVPDAPSDVAFLESFASQMFAGRGTYGWNGGWAGDVYLVLCYAQLQPRVIYDQTVQAEGLDAFKVLVLVDCDVLLQSVVDKIRAWQARGGLVIGDERLCPAIQPDIFLPSYTRPKEADMARSAMMEAVESLREQLDAHYRRPAAASDPSVITRLRRYGTTDYLFAINDLREFGTYVGHHGLVMENGLPIEARLYVNRPDGYVYDLVAHRMVAHTRGEGFVSIDAAFGPCEGKLLMISSRPVAGVTVGAPEQAETGAEFRVQVTVVDYEGTALDAVVPVRLEIADPDGRPTEFSGHYGARDGSLRVDLRPAPNDTPGLWRIRATELASGIASEAYVRVTEPR